MLKSKQSMIIFHKTRLDAPNLVIHNECISSLQVPFFLMVVSLHLIACENSKYFNTWPLALEENF